MREILDVVRMMVDGGVTWQETIIMSMAIIGATLSVLIIVRGGVSLLALIIKMIERAFEKIPTQKKE